MDKDSRFDRPSGAVVSAAPGGTVDLAPMLPRWARQQAMPADADTAEAAAIIPVDAGGHFPTLPLPPAGASAIALLSAAVAAKTGVRFVRQLRLHRFAFNGRKPQP